MTWVMVFLWLEAGVVQDYVSVNVEPGLDCAEQAKSIKADMAELGDSVKWVCIGPEGEFITEEGE